MSTPRQPSAPLTPELLRTLRELEAKATPGPWEAWVKHGDIFQGPLTKNTPSHARGVKFRIADCGEYDEDGDEQVPREATGNRDLIVAMRNALPALLDAAETLIPLSREVEDLRTFLRGAAVQFNQRSKP